jgi:chorismate mutase/prephenate dehydratase
LVDSGILAGNILKSKQKIIVAYQGEQGAYSEVAAHRFFHCTIGTRPSKTLTEVFKDVEEKIADYGIVPVENSLEGSVNETYDLLLESDVKVFGEVNLKVTHCLIAFPGTGSENVNTVYSHPQALAQCRRYILKHGYETIPFYDTAGSVKMIREKKLADAAAIASKQAAHIYNMSILDRGIEDHPYNFTRFFVLALKDAIPTGRDKTSIIFSTKHVPGSLYEVLEEFAKRRINLTKIESRPTKQKPWEYHFYLDFEGHRKERYPKEALRTLKRKTLFLKVLGSYPKSSPV